MWARMRMRAQLEAVRFCRPIPHTGIFVYFARTTQTDLSFVVDFDKDPRRMILTEAGPSARSGSFAPIDRAISKRE